MRTRKKIWIGAGIVLLGIGAAVLTAVSILAPAYLNTPGMKATIEARASRAIGGEVRYKSLVVSLFPRLHAVAGQVNLSTRFVTGNIKSITVYPRFSSLLKGKLLISKIILQEPRVAVKLQKKTGQELTRRPPPAEELESEIRSVESIAPGFAIRIEKGKVELSHDRSVLSLRNLDLDFVAPPETAQISLKADSDEWGPVFLKASLMLDRKQVELKDLAFGLGHSSLTGISARISLARPSRFSLVSGSGSLSLDELHRWFSSSQVPARYLKDIRSVKGKLNFSSITAAGLFSDPESWEIQIDGQAEKILIDSKLLPALLLITGNFSAGNKTLDFDGLSASLGKSSVSGVSAGFSWGTRPLFEISSGQGEINLDEVFRWRSSLPALDALLKDVSGLKGRAIFSSISAGPFSNFDMAKMTVSGRIENVIFDSDLVPGRVTIGRGAFSFARGKFSFHDVDAALLDASLILAGSIDNLPKPIESVELSLKGPVAKDGIDWLFSRFALPVELKVKPLSFAPVHFSWKKSSGILLNGILKISNGPELGIELSKNSTELALRRVAAKDQDSDAVLSYRNSEAITEISFSGTLNERTLARIFVQPPAAGRGTVQGAFHARIRSDKPQESSAKGKLNVRDFVVPYFPAAPLILNSFSIEADKNRARIESASGQWGEGHFSTGGEVTVSPEGFVLNIDLFIDKLNINEIQDALKAERPETGEEKKEGGPKTGRKAKPNLLGMVQLESQAVTFGRYTFSPLKAIATFGPPGVSASITDAQVCGVSLPGTVSIFGEDVDVDFKPAIEKQEIAYSISCLTGLDVHITGNYSLNADIRMRGKNDALLPTLEGSVDFKAKGGKIYRYPALAKIFSVLSITEIFRGKTPELGGSGFPYKTMVLKGVLHQGKLRLEKAYIGGSSVDLIAEGEIDFARKKMNLVVLVAPFSTINWIIRHIPLVGKVMGGTLISIPVKVSGDISNPDVTFLDPSAVGSRIVELFKNIVQLPVEIISPFLPKKEQK